MDDFLGLGSVAPQSAALNHNMFHVVNNNFFCGETLSENSQGGAVHANSMETNSE